MDLDEFESKYPERRGISLSRIHFVLVKKSRTFPLQTSELSLPRTLRMDLASGHWTLSLANGSVYAHSQEDYVLDQHLELFSFLLILMVGF